MLLAGDIGGTKTRLACFELQAGRLVQHSEAEYPSREHQGLEEIALAFVGGLDCDFQAAGFGIAGPVVGGRAVASNLPWVVDQASLAERLGLPGVALLNDLAATALGIAELPPEALVTLNAGVSDPDGPIAVIAAGTGLGEAGLISVNGRRIPLPGEGGHCDFAPRNELEYALLRHLQTRFDHVSVERVISGPGLVNIYAFLRDTGWANEQPTVAARMTHQDPAAVISELAQARRDPLCSMALTLFVSLYGAEAGNLALRLLATGGVYVGGGIAPRISETLRGGDFLRAFLEKGRMRALLERVPLQVVMNDRAALLGAARAALESPGAAD